MVVSSRRVKEEEEKEGKERDLCFLDWALTFFCSFFLFYFFLLPKIYLPPSPLPLFPLFFPPLPTSSHHPGTACTQNKGDITIPSFIVSDYNGALLKKAIQVQATATPRKESNIFFSSSSLLFIDKKSILSPVSLSLPSIAGDDTVVVVLIFNFLWLIEKWSAKLIFSFSFFFFLFSFLFSPSQQKESKYAWRGI